MFEDMTKEKILSDLLSQAPPDIDTRPGSIYYDAVKGTAIVMSRMYSDLSIFTNLIYIDSTGGEYLDKTEPAAAEGYVMPYGESPFDNEDAARDIYLEIMNGAEDYLYITAPYLNIDDEVEDAICSAAERGVEVILIVPGIPDKLYMEILARTHYERLVLSGVKLYRYTPGFIHSKVFVSDDRVATVGSINLNSRSFYRDFECGAVLTDVKCIADIKADILDTLDECVLVTEDNIIPLSPAEEIRAAMMANLEGSM